MNRARRQIPALVLIASLPLAAAAAGTSRATTVEADLPQTVTYAADVAPIFGQKCVRCHRPGDIAPMSLMAYEEVRPWAKKIRRVVRERTMPPWHADPRYGNFRNDRSLSDREIAILERWVRQGTKLGDPADLPEPSLPEEGWRLGAPDAVVTFDEVTLPGDGPDVFHDLTAETPIEEARWLRAVEVLPGDRRVVHHVIMYALDAEGKQGRSGWIGAWAAGMEPMIFPEGTAKLLEPGGRLVADMHYHPSGEEATDQTRLGLYFYDGEPEKELINLWVQNSSFRIPAGADNHEVRSSYTFPQDSTIHGLLPHMHYRGKDFTYTATYPDGRSEILLQVNEYDFNWQTLYELAEPLAMPKGTRLDCVAHYDNSRTNPANPDPTVAVTFGNESYDEMMIGFVDFVVDEGMRPLGPEERITQLLAELSRAHPGEVYAVRVRQGETAIDTTLHFPRSGEGTWYIPLNGQVYEATLAGIESSDSGYTATLTAPFGVLAVSGSHPDEGGRIAGGLEFQGNQLTFEGRRVDESP